MSNSKNVVLIFLTCLFSGLAFGQQDSLLKGDSAAFGGGKGYVTVQLFLLKDPATFFYTYRDNHWLRVYSGVYSIIGDSIHLKCTSDCDKWTRGFRGPVIVEDCDYSPKESSFYFLSTEQDTLTNFTAEILLDTTDQTDHSLPCNKYIEIKSADTVVVVQQLTNCNPHCFTILIPLDMLHPERLPFHHKVGLIENGNIRLDDMVLKYIQLRPYDGKTKGKKQKKE